MNAARLFVLCVVCALPMSAQQKALVHLQRMHALNSGPVEAPAISSSPDSIRILAVMIDFPGGVSTTTTGNGKFQLQSYPRTVDPPPHNISYFQNKVQFVRNYFRKVSNGKLTVVGTVLNQVLTVSQPMSSYGPPAGSNSKGLALLASEAWHLADSAFTGFPFSQYDAFILFHAGVGHDINITNILGYDPSPFDLPSLYLGLQAFKDAYQDQSFVGIPVSGGNFKIKNTIILPETDSHVIPDSFGTPDTILVSINGLFAASIGSYLGLPDLWDTKTGREGIGQFGLEDGASFFAFYGLFPPEPSAWEKIRLGWVTPITINSSRTNIPAPAVSLGHLGPSFFGQDTIYRIPITEREYFLVENRSRDPLVNGQTLKLVQSGSVISKTFLQDTVGFNNNEISGITGSLIDAEDFDWAMLGLIDTNGTVNGVKDNSHNYDGGGILIWHIDEDVIDANLATNTVNADQNRKGIYLEEAKGAQDIGQSYAAFTGGSGNENGSPLDAWFLGNIGPTYTNRFDRNSFPNSNSNSGAYSLVTIKDFSARLPRMSFTVQFGDDYLQPLPGFPKFLGPSATDKSVQAWTNGMYVRKGDSVYVFRSDGKSGVPDSTGLLTANGGEFPLAFLIASPNTWFVGAKDSSLLLFRVVDVNGDGIFDSVQSRIVNIGHRITTQPTLNGTNIVLGHADGGVIQVNPLSSQLSNIVTGASGQVQSVVFSNVAVTQTGVKDSSNRTFPFATPFSGFAVGSGGAYIFIVDTVQRTLLVLKNDLSFLSQISLNTWSGSISKPAAADILRTGDEEVLITIGNKIAAFSSRGYLIEGFPVNLANEAGNASPPVVHSLTLDRVSDVLSVSSTGQVKAYDRQGKLLTGFPIVVGSSVTGTPAIFPIAVPASAAQTGISVLTDDGRLFAYEISVQYVPVDPLPIVPISSDFLPAERVYNYPNPVYGGSTRIRFYSVQDANISIKIFDLAGEKITELRGRAVAGIDGEVVWDVTHIQSGVYLARVEASNQNQTQARIVKIAVVK